MMAQTFAAHPGGMPGHGGMPHGGHPMASGHPSNQGLPGGGQPVVSMGPQMHTGMAGGPGGPQGGQTASIMAGISQAGGIPAVTGPIPSAHALSHLNPAQSQQLIHQQHQQMQQASKFLSLLNAFCTCLCLLLVDLELSATSVLRTMVLGTTVDFRNPMYMGYLGEDCPYALS